MPARCPGIGWTSTRWISPDTRRAGRLELETLRSGASLSPASINGRRRSAATGHPEPTRSDSGGVLKRRGGRCWRSGSYRALQYSGKRDWRWTSGMPAFQAFASESEGNYIEQCRDIVDGSDALLVECWQSRKVLQDQP